jgi:MFS family permease
VAGATGLASFAAIRSLGAPAWAPQFLAVAGQIPWLLAPGFEAFTRRLDARRAFVWLGIVANVPLLAVALLPVTETGEHGRGLGPWMWFVGAVIVLNPVDALYLPLRSALIRANYVEAVRGRYFGWLSAVSKSATVASSKFGGALLDHDPRLLRLYFPLAGIAGIVEHVLISRIRWHRAEAVRPVEAGEGFLGHFAASLREGWAILARDRDFRIYETGFMLYGLGFLASHPLVAEFMDRTLHLSYGEATWAMGFAEPVSYLMVALLVGPVLHRIGLLRATAVSFAVLACFFGSLASVATPAAFVALYFVFGGTMAGVNLGWNLGPMKFAPPGRARAYAAVHMVMVGVRITIAPLLGYALSRAVGTRAVFVLSAVLVAAGAVTTGLLARRVR